MKTNSVGITISFVPFGAFGVCVVRGSGAHTALELVGDADYLRSFWTQMRLFYGEYRYGHPCAFQCVYEQCRIPLKVFLEIDVLMRLPSLWGLMNCQVCKSR
jgi:hypothetical protein